MRASLKPSFREDDDVAKTTPENTYQQLVVHKLANADVGFVDKCGVFHKI